MKVLIKIIYKTLLYSAPVLLFYFYLEFRLSRLENSYSYKIKNFEAIEANCEILVLGNSQMLKGVNPDFLGENAYNFANVSQTLIIDEAILKKYISHLPKLKLVIIGLCYTSFGEDLGTSDEAWRLSFYEKYYGIDINEKFDIKDYSNIMRYQPYEALKMSLKNFHVDLIKDIQPNGWMKITGINHSKLTDDWAKQRADLHTKSLDKSNIKKNVDALKRMIILLKHEGIQVILFSPMVRDNYYKSLSPAWLAKNDSIMLELEREFLTEFMDYSKWHSDELDNCFNDVDHLNKQGAEKLSKLLRENIQ